MRLHSQRGSCGVLQSARISKIIFRGIVFIAIFASAAFFIIKSAASRKPASLSRSVPVMGTILEIRLYGDEKLLPSAAEAAICEIRNLEEIFSIFGDGEAAQINASADKAPFRCSSRMWGLLRESATYYSLSEGAFDVTIRPMMLLWGFYRKREGAPSDEEITGAMSKIGFYRLKFDEENKSVFFTAPGMSLDFGGIAKGYAVDRAWEKVVEHNVRCGFINLGGNIRTLPEPPHGKKSYNIGIRHPFEKDHLCGTATLEPGEAIATSGNYERYVVLDGKHITHVINPADGRPIQNMLSASVIAPTATAADAFSTSIFIGGEKLAKKLHAANPNLKFLIIEARSNSALNVIKFGHSWSELEF